MDPTTVRCDCHEKAAVLVQKKTEGKRKDEGASNVEKRMYAVTWKIDNDGSVHDSGEIGLGIFSGSAEIIMI